MRALILTFPLMLGACGSEASDAEGDWAASEPAEPVITCDDLADQVVMMTQEEDVKILKIYEITQTQENDSLTLCEGDAALSTSDERQKVYFKLETDEDGDQFVGYSPEPYTE